MMALRSVVGPSLGHARGLLGSLSTCGEALSTVSSAGEGVSRFRVLDARAAGAWRCLGARGETRRCRCPKRPAVAAMAVMAPAIVWYGGQGGHGLWGAGLDGTARVMHVLCAPLVCTAVGNDRDDQRQVSCVLTMP